MLTESRSGFSQFLILFLPKKLFKKIFFQIIYYVKIYYIIAYYIYNIIAYII